MSKKKDDHLDLIVLRTVNNDYDLNLIKNLLDEEEIPYLVKDRGIGGYMRIIGGSHLYGTDILVDESILESAEAALDKIEWD